ncbi:ATP-binding cassette domain-containing protein [candidate division WOR-3 bacterium]|uniref:ATP-binding cassette domain-containing protein n=1 Tax=candidate division WOR-3 bacterium TaxID=2052148 RepID=A0A9D5K8M1_UNCW3|nr:ATP-binding cassette domain-containing protein [candidate division WOR-3 bacterium]MBD3364366.1 ATP-binding cassette domain-containing protein [candidate division WOR-3 bacterium]
MISNAIAVEGLKKRFDDVQALSGISFNVGKGELFGFLGPNGAGKTTTINVLTGLARADAGTVVIGGIDCTHKPRAAQHLVGIVPDESNLYPELTGFGNLCFCAALYGMSIKERKQRAQRLLADFGLSKAADRKFATYSKGMKRKLTVAAGIIHRPRILFLDEPTTGIDVASARGLRRLIAELNREGITIFLTTHYIEEAERLCDRIAFIVSGRIVKTDSVAHLLQPLKGRHILEITFSGARASIKQELSREFPGLDFELSKHGIIRVEAGEEIRVGPLVRFLEEQDAEVAEARKVRPSLEEVFIKVTGIEAEAMRAEKEKKGKGR